MKLNIGSNKTRLDGYLNLDGLDLDEVDAVCELNHTPYELKIRPENLEKFGDKLSKSDKPEDIYRFLSNTIERINAVEFLEHISFKDTYLVLQEWIRILEPSGVVHIQVPDCGKAMEYYVNNEICECVPHKGTNEQQVADKMCFSCGGKAKINPNRWLYSFTGAQKHKYDAHLNIFTKERLTNSLLEAGFRNIEFTDDPFKLKVKAEK